MWLALWYISISVIATFNFLHCLATAHSLLGTLLSTSALLFIVPSLLLPTPPLWRAFYCTMVRCTVLRGKSLSPYMAQYSPIAEHQGDCLQYTQSGDGGLTRETAVTHSSSGQFSTNQEPTNLIQWPYNFILWFFFSVDYHYYTNYSPGLATHDSLVARPSHRSLFRYKWGKAW